MYAHKNSKKYLRIRTSVIKRFVSAASMFILMLAGLPGAASASMDALTFPGFDGADTPSASTIFDNSQGTSDVFDEFDWGCSTGTDIFDGDDCGNGVVDPGEECDGNAETYTCTNSSGYAGERTCNILCRWNVCHVSERCGDGVKNGDEECDGQDGLSPGEECNLFCKKTAIDYDNYISGHKLIDADGLASTTDDRSFGSGWTINLYIGTSSSTLFSSTSTDGNGYYVFSNLSPGTYHLEEVMQSNWAMMSGPAQSITVTKTSASPDNDFINYYIGPICGNGVVEEGESCDDSNIADGDGCSAVCQTESSGGGGGSSGGSSGGGGSVPISFLGGVSTVADTVTMEEVPLVLGEEAAPDLSITKTVDKSDVNPGDAIEYKITIKNNGNLAAYNVMLSDSLDKGLVFSDSGKQEMSNVPIGTIDAGDSKELKYKVKVNADAKAGKLKNVAMATADNNAEVRAEVSVNVKIPVVLAETGFEPLEMLSLLLLMFSLFGASLYIGRHKLEIAA